MSFNYKNPITPLTSLGNQSVPRKSIYGTNFSILGTGGYMEVYSSSDLYFTIPSGNTGLIEFSANTIPIQFNKGTGSIFSPDVLTLNSDNISSGRRRIGMLVYVIDEDQIYQYQIPNFESLWSGATGATGPGGNTVVFSEFGTTIKSNSPEGIAFISAWTSNIIEGVSGGTSTNSVWKKLVTGGGGGGGAFTGGTVTGDTFFTNGVTATTFSAATYLGLPIDVYVTGGTYSGDTITFTNNTGGTFTVTGITTSGGGTFTGGTVTGETFFTSGLTATVFSAGTYLGLPIDVYVTGGTYSAGTVTFINNTGGTFDVSGFYTGGTDYFVTGGTFDKNTETLTLNRNDGNSVTITGFTDVFVTGATYSNNTFTFINNTGGTFDVSFDILTGLTVNGDFSATTIYGNGSNITGINFSQLATTAHTHPISEVINLQNSLDSKIDKPASPFLGDYLYYNGITWVPNQVNIPVAAGAGVTLFLSVSGSSLMGYEYLSQFPFEVNEVQETVIVNNNQLLIGKYATDQLNRTVVDPGIWEFNTYASVDIPSTGLTQIIVSVYLLTTGGTETFLFSSATENITTTAATLYTMSVVEQQYSCNTTDYLVVNYSGSTTNSFNTTVTLYHGGSVNYSHIHTPFITLHNDLAGLQGGLSNEYYHLSKNEVDLLTTGVDASSIHNHDSSYLSLSGGTVSGNTNINGSFSATTYLGLPIDSDKFVTGFTYNNNTFTISDNSGSTFSATINTMTGLTVNGNLSVTGNTSLQGLTATTFSAATYQNLPTDIRVTGATYNNNNQFTFTNNTGGTFNVSFNQVSGLTVNGNLSVTGNTNVRGITGTSALISGSAQNVLTVYGSGSTSPIFTVQGSQGELFSVTDSLTGSLYSVNNISGLPILEVFSDDTILMGNYLAPSLNTTARITANSGTTNIYSIPTSAYTGAFYDYTVADGSNARAGNIMTIFSGSSVQFTETSTLDIGTTTGVTFSVVISSGNAILRVSATTNNWVVKTIVRSI